MNAWRDDFPFLQHAIDGKPLIYFDSAATSQKPQTVIDTLTDFYTRHNSNIARAVYPLAERTTQLYEDARATVAEFINADAQEVVFTKGTTEGINFIASTWAADHIKKGDEILLTQMEHHSNMIPWQQLAQRAGAHLQYIPVLPDGTLDYDSVPKLISAKTKLVAVVHVSNTLGTHNDIARIRAAARTVGAKLLIDAAQSAGHQPIDVKQLGCDFLAFSGHKMLGPTGIGVLYIKKEMQGAVRPYQFGGGMIFEADFYHASFQKPPHKFEAGTPPIAQAIGLAAAIRYMRKKVQFDRLQAHESELCRRLIGGLQAYKKVRILGPISQLQHKGHLVSFAVEGIHAHDVAAHLAAYGICVRAGHHCAQPLAGALGTPSSVRVSFYLYNTLAEVEKFLEVLELLVRKK